MHLTQALPGTGGTFTPSVLDFEVEEVPLYLPCGEGDHLYITFEKQGLTTRDVVTRAAQVFGAAEPEIGYAGLKDKHATTRQTISIHGAKEADAARLDGDGVRVLGAKLHKNKLRVGHLVGNRFRAVVRGTEPGALERAQAVLEVLGARGLPNVYGEQRFGAGGGNVAAGRAILLEGRREKPWKAKLLLSALQSDLFNRVLEARMARGAFDRVLCGDVLQKVASGGLFTSADAAVDQLRFDGFEVSITGPIFGPKMRAPTGEPAAWEAEVLASAGLTLADFRRGGRLTEGTRRPLRVPVGAPSAVAVDGGVELRFELPAGAYATVLIDEVVKPARG